MPDEKIALKPISGYDETLYTPDVEKKDYTPTWLEWAAQNFQQISRAANQAGTGGATIYTVPTGFTFYLTNVSITGIEGGSSGVITPSGSRYELISLKCSANNTATNSSCFSVPLKMNAGETINLIVAGAAANVTADITGFLVRFSA